jgi:hypothetical protein
LSIWFNGMQPRFRTIDGCPAASPKASIATITPYCSVCGRRILFAFEPLWARLAEHTHLLATARRKLNGPHHRAPRRFTRG